MNTHSYSPYQVPSQLAIHHVALLRPFKWLALAWQDLRHHPKASLAHGLIVSSLILGTLLITNIHVYVIAAAISGFMLIGPILASGLCELSRRDERGESVSFDDSLAGLKDKQSSLIRFAGILLAVSLLWFVISGLVLATIVGDITPSLQQTLWGNVLDFISPINLILYSVIGGILASIVFVVSVVSVPAMIDSSVSAQQAMAVSSKATTENLATMIVWAALIAVLSVIGFASLLLGMIVIYPLLGHATWHAYRDLVKTNENRR